MKPQIRKLKNEARRHEQRANWERAIDLYRQALLLDEESDSASADLSLYNRIGDLYLRKGDTAAAVNYYERAVERYAAQDLTTSAVALCNKTLRLAPGRTEMYRVLGRLHVANGLQAEARENYLEYATRMLQQGGLAAALEAMHELAETTSDDGGLLSFVEILVERDHREDAVAELRRVWEERVRRRADAEPVRQRIVEIDPEADPGAPEEFLRREAHAREAAVEPAPVGDGDGVAHGEETVDLGAVLVREMDLASGEWAGLGGERPPDSWPGPSESDDEVAEMLASFRDAVSEIVEESDYAVHYDLGVAYKEMGLYDAAIAEFQIATGSPRYLAAAREALDECAQAKERRESKQPSEAKNGMPPAATALGAEVAAAEATPVGSPATEAGEATVAPTEEEPDRLTTLFFEARLAQFRARQAASAHRTDYQAHYELGVAYREMGLIAEAAREFRVASHGPRVLAARALDAIEDIATLSTVDLEERLDLLHYLHEAGRSTRALALLLELWDEQTARGVDAQEIENRIREIDPAVDPVLRSEPVAGEPEEGQVRPGPPEVEAAETADAEVSASDAASEIAEAQVREGGGAEVGNRALEAMDVPSGDGSAAGEANGPAPPVEEAALPELSSMLDELVRREDEAPPVSRPDVLRAPHVGRAVFPGGRRGAQPPVGDPDAIARYAQVLLDEGQLESAVRELDRAREGYEARRQVRRAIEVVDRLLRLTPEDVVLYHQKVEYAFMTNDRHVLLRSYHDLAACLRRQGAVSSARAVYGRILDIDPENAEAAAAIEDIDETELDRERRAQRRGPGAAWRRSARRTPAYFNLGEMLRAELTEEVPGDGLDPEIAEDEFDFDAMLDAFRSKVTETLDDTDYESHFELGVAFKQMDMLDEAIREFQLAIRGLEDPLRAYELLGECFIAQERYGVATKLLSRVSSLEGFTDKQLLGVLYQQGIAYQALGERARALECFERVFGVDIDHRDVADRIASCSV
ncbi:MAG: tetratricopeptide repeat protein [Gemmatimonadota bacterium]